MISKSGGDRKFAGERIPTLDEVLAAVKDRCALNIELKAKHSERQVCELMRKYRVLDTSTSTMPSMISSFEWDLLWRARELEPAIRIGMLAEKKPERLIAEAIARRVAAINPRFDLATAELCAQAHRNGLKVYAWTVDAPEAMRALAENGVDGIMTNYPERLRALIGGVSVMFAQDKIEELRNRADIVEVIGAHVRLRRVGNRFSGLCPFHNEKTPSFSVSPERGFFHCFGCGAGGTVFNFVMRIEGLSFPEAVSSLAARYGIALPERGASGAKPGERDALFRANEVASEFFAHVLWDIPTARRLATT